MNWRFLLLLLLLGLAAGSTAFFLARSGLLRLPTSPAAGEGQEVSLLEEAEIAERRIADRFPEASVRRPRGEAPSRQLELRLHESDLRDLAIAGLSRHPEGRRLLELARQIRAEIADGEIGLELVVNLSEIPRDRLSDKERETVEKLEGLVPLLGRSDIPIGLYGSPEASRGRIRLGGSPWMKLSILKLSLDTVSERLGIPVDDLERSLEIEWPGFEVLDVTVDEDVLELRVLRSA